MNIFSNHKSLFKFTVLVAIVFVAVQMSQAQNGEKKPEGLITITSVTGKFERKGMSSTIKPTFTTVDVSKLKSGTLYVEFKLTGKCGGELAASSKPSEDGQPQIGLAHSGLQNFHEFARVKKGVIEQFQQSQMYVYAKVQQGMFVYYEGDCSADYQYTIYFLETNSTCSTIPYNPAQPMKNEPLYSDWRLNGNDYTYPKFVRGQTDTVIFYVNGIETGLSDAKIQMEKLSGLTNSTVWLTYNSSSLNSAVNVTAKHYNESPNAWNKYWTVKNPERIDWAKENALNNPPAARSLASSVEGLSKQGVKVAIIGYSQGAAIVREAMKCFSPQFNSGNVRVLLIGGASKTSEVTGAGIVSGFAHKSDGISEVFGDAPKTDSYVSDLSNTYQHTNYFEGQSTARGNGDAEAIALIKRWMKGENFGFKLLNNVP